MKESLTELAVKLGLPIGKIYREIVSGETISQKRNPKYDQ